MTCVLWNMHLRNYELTLAITNVITLISYGPLVRSPSKSLCFILLIRMLTSVAYRSFGGIKNVRIKKHKLNKQHKSHFIWPRYSYCRVWSYLCFLISLGLCLYSCLQNFKKYSSVCLFHLNQHAPLALPPN